MNLFSKINNICLADFRERTRNYNFLILLGLVIFASFFIIPSSTNSGKDLYLVFCQSYKPVYNSAFIGTASSFLCIMTLSLFGFYVINNSIQRDRQTRVGEIIASSNISKNSYIVGKFLSNFLVLFIILVINALVMIIIYFLRGQEPINFYQLLTPFFIWGIPVLALVSAMAVFFESIGFLKGTLGNVIYFFLWSTITSLECCSSENTNISTLDLFGLKTLNQSFANTLNTNIKSSEIGLSWIYGNPKFKGELLFNGVIWSKDILIQRAIIIIMALLLAILASVFFDRFVSNDKKKKKASKNKLNIKNEVCTQNTSIPTNVSISTLTPVSYNYNFISLVKSELKLLLKNLNFWIILSEIGLNISALFAPIQIVQNYLLPIMWLLPIAVWSSMGNREVHYNVDQIVFSTENYNYRQLPACLFAGMIISIITGSGFFIRLLITNNVQSILPFIVGAMFIPSLAMCLGVLSNSSKLFEVIYFTIWYLGPMNHVAILNFIEIINPSYAKTLLFIVISIIFLLISLLIRQVKIESK